MYVIHVSLRDNFTAPHTNFNTKQFEDKDKKDKLINFVLSGKSDAVILEEFNNVLEEHDNEYGEEDVVDTEEEGEDKDETTDVDEEEDKKDEEEEEDEEEDDEKEEEGDSKTFGCYGKSENITVKSKNSDNDEFIFASISGSDLKKGKELLSTNWKIIKINKKGKGRRDNDDDSNSC